MIETWRPVVGYEDFYEVSDLGQIRSLDRVMPHARYPGHTQRLTGRVLSPGISNGYLSVVLSAEARRRVVKVHTIVAEAFLGPRPTDRVACHENGIRTDNRLINLRYDTVSANVRDAVRHGTHSQASKTHCKRGHEFTPQNISWTSEGGRRCRACRRLRKQ